MVYVRDVVREVVAEQAAHELPLVDSLRELDDAGAVRALASRRQRREPLGFGYAEVAGLIAPVVWLVLDQAARRGVDTATESLMERLRSGTRRLLRRGPDATEPVVIELEPGELALVRTQIVERATERGMERAEAEALADSVVARIAMAPATSGTQSETPDDPS